MEKDENGNDIEIIDDGSIDNDDLFSDLVSDTPAESGADNPPAEPELDADGNPIEQPPVDEPKLDADGNPIEEEPKLDADGNPIETNTPPAEEPKLDADGNPIEPEKEPEGGTENLSGIEQYLAQFDIEGGMIQFEDGTSQHFDELDSEKQAEILSQLHDKQAATVEDKYGLDEGEISLINYIRENKTTAKDMINELANERVQAILAAQSVGGEDYDKMPEDSVYMNFLKRSNPDATPEQLEEDLEKAKQQNNYKNVVESVRSQFKTEQQTEATRLEQEETQRQAAVIEEQRQLVLDTVVNMQEIDGIQLNNGTKNGILDHVLEVNDHGDSLFMEEVFSKPDSLFKAAFWFYNGPEMMKQRDEYWKKEKSAAYKRGRESALGKEGSQISFTKKPDTKGGSTPTSTSSQTNDNFIDLDTLHIED
jgi:hypothetical protein